MESQYKSPSQKCNQAFNSGEGKRLFVVAILSQFGIDFIEISGGNYESPATLPNPRLSSWKVLLKTLWENGKAGLRTGRG
ncbi:TPA: hypothetical protein ACU21S_002069 [Mannheimia haemolytica]